MNLSTHSAGVVLAGLVTLAGVASPAPLASQDPPSTPTFLALPESFPEIDARVVLLREPSRDIVVLNPAEANVESLGIALMLLRRLRRETPTPVRGQMIPVTGFAFGRELSAAQRQRLERALSRLRGRPLSNVGDLGPGRWVRFGRR